MATLAPTSGLNSRGVNFTNIENGNHSHAFSVFPTSVGIKKTEKFGLFAYLAPFLML